MTEDEVVAFVCSDQFHTWAHSAEFRRRGVEFDQRLEAGEWFTVEAAAVHFKLPVAVFRYVFGGYLTMLAVSSGDTGTRH